MQRRLRVCLYNTDEGTGEQIHRALGEMPHLEVIAEVPDWDRLRDCVNSTQADMILVNLDADFNENLQIVQFLVRLAPGIGIIGVSGRNDPQSIIQAMRAGCTQFVCSPIETEDLASAITRVQATRMSVAHTSYRICAVGSAGGVGATTVACNLALELGHLIDRPSALVDLNLEFGDAACAFDCEPSYSVADLCRGGTELDPTIIEAAMHVLPCNVHLLGRPERVQDAHEVAPESVARLLEFLGTIYANVVIDLPRGFNFFSAAAIERTDLVLVVAQLSVPSIRNASRIYQLLKQMGANMDTVEIVLNRCNADYERITPADVEQHFGRPVFGAIPNDYQRVMASLDFGHPILADSPRSPARVAIQEMAKKIASKFRTEEADPPQRKGLFSRLWGRKEPASQ